MPFEARVWWERAPRYAVPSAALRWDGRSLPEELAEVTRKFPGCRHVERVEDWGGGLWRRVLYPRRCDWPAVATSFERSKYRCVLPRGGGIVWKFEGLAGVPGHAGTGAEVAFQRQQARADAGWCAPPLGIACGFIATPWVPGRPLRRADADPELAAAIGRYIGSVAGPPLPPNEQSQAIARLVEMLYWNTREALGEKAAARARAAFESLDPDCLPPLAYGDGRLAPHEWRLAEDAASGRAPSSPGLALLKTDATGHDLDHTVVGRQSVAWDAAGAVVEWGMDAPCVAALLAALEAACGCRLSSEVLAGYRAAYAAFRIGQCALAQASADDPEEAARLRRAGAAYRRELGRLLGSTGRPADGHGVPAVTTSPLEVATSARQPASTR